MFLRFLSAAAIAMCVVSGAANAATLENLSGRVFVDRGAGFVPADEGTIKIGDRVKATAGTASINYGGGVIVPVRSGQTVRVSEVYGQTTGRPQPQTPTLTETAAGVALAVGIACIGFCGDDDDDDADAFSP